MEKITVLGATRRIELARLAGQEPDPDDVAVVEESKETEAEREVARAEYMEDR